MIKPKSFKSKSGNIPLPIFFPDATRAVVRTVDSLDLINTKTPGVLVNTLHLFNEYGERIVQKLGGISKFMSYKGAFISDSGGFQVGSLIKKNPLLGKVTNQGVIFKMEGQTPSVKGKKVILTPESSIEFQMNLSTDLVVVLDDFDASNASYVTIKDSVDRTILWAQRSKDKYLEICRKRKLDEVSRPYIIGVVQGGRYRRLRKYCIDALLRIGFDGFGYGGEEKIGGIKVDYSLAGFMAKNTPRKYLLYGLGVGKPEDIVALSKLGFNIFDCVLPTRDARHKRLYVYNADSIDKINLKTKDFYFNLVPDKNKYLDDMSPVSKACDCILCKNYPKSYLAYLFKIRELSALRLSTIHNLRFYSLLMEKIREQGLY